MRIRIINLDDAVTGQPLFGRLFKSGDADQIDARDLTPRLRLVAARSAMRELDARLGPPLNELEVFFLGSGDFHHLTWLLLQRGTSPITLIHFDNHPDWVRFGFPLNCGSWVNRALELERVAKVVTIGPCSDDLQNPEFKGANLPAIRSGRLEVHAWSARPTRLWGSAVNGPGVVTDGSRLVWQNVASCDWSRFMSDLGNRLPTEQVWISIDKDVLTSADAITNWDQGEMTLAHIADAIGILSSRHRIAGIDICGDYSVPHFRDPMRAFLSATDREQVVADPFSAMSVNQKTNERLISMAGALAN